MRIFLTFALLFLLQAASLAQIAVSLPPARPLTQLPDTATILIMGDVMMHRDQISNSSRPDGQYDFSTYFTHIGDVIKGTGWTKMHPELEYADYYRAGGLKKLSAAEVIENEKGAPWTGEVPALSVYEWRGCRMLDKKRWGSKCKTCKWACMANVTIEYNWGVSQKFRFETF